jgi:hypothetical protein
MQKGMDQNLLCHIWLGWTSMYQLFGGSAGVIQFWTHIKFFKNMDISCIKTTVCIYICLFSIMVYLSPVYGNLTRHVGTTRRYPNPVASASRVRSGSTTRKRPPGEGVDLGRGGAIDHGNADTRRDKGVTYKDPFLRVKQFFLKPWSGPKVWQWSKFICSVLFTNTKYIIYPLFSANVAVAGWKISLNKGLYISLGKLSMEIPKLKWRRWGIVNCHVWWHVLGTKYGIPLFHVMLFPEPAVERFDLSWCWLDS